MSELGDVLFKRSPGATLVLNGEGRVVRTNREACRALARSAGELAGRPVLSVFVPEDRGRARRNFLRVLSGEEREWLGRCVRGGGATSTQWIRATPVGDEGGARSIVMFLRDVSDGGGVPPDTRQLQTLLENVPGQFVAVIDTAGVVRYASRVSRTHFRDDVEVVGTLYENLLQEGEINPLHTRDLLEMTAAGKHWCGTQWHVRADGAVFPALVVATPYRDASGGRILGALVVGRDLSSEYRWRARAEQCERLAEVGRLVAGVASQMREATAAVAAALRYDSVHGTTGPSGSPVLEDLARLRALSDAIERLAEVGWFERPERIDLPREVSEVVRALAPEVERRRAKLEYDLPAALPAVHAGRNQVRAMVQALLVNALESVPPGHGIRIRVAFSVVGRGERVRMTIRDDGPGIPDEIRPRVKEPFVSTKPGHSGLGLTLADAVAVSLQGSLSVESSDSGKGVTVAVELPRVERGSRVRYRPVPLNFRHSRSVLIVDDEQSVRLSVRRFLERVGYEVREAWSGRSALAQITAGKPPDLILTDLRMADGSGSWLMDQIARDFPHLLRRTVIITGASEEEGLAALAQETGCPVLQKPLDLPRLLDVLDELATQE